ncbi:DUF937 domain-containing protein [Mesonia sp. K7]|uniref:DUF937 domain-containing protein n=1 Tax=Mesonia sp. K7 TaxID=2218606 RepID=UPI000DA7902D|nr:DUF937 domain-containing protein [Mesonia sp. K7]PZD76505.1 hypothetical protein DNG35_11850 [Mesonia sp. K7]
MANILDLLKTDSGQELIEGASRETGVSSDQVGSVLAMAMPALMGAMKRNIQTPQGAESLNNALNDSRHDGSILNNLGSLLGGGSIDSSLLADGAGILRHVLGGNDQRLNNNIGRATGVDSGSVGKIIQIALPIIMGFLGRQKRNANVESGGLGDLIGTAMGTSSKEEGSLLETLLDADGDGSIIDDVAGKLLGGNKSGGGLLGKLFG